MRQVDAGVDHRDVRDARLMCRGRGGGGDPPDPRRRRLARGDRHHAVGLNDPVDADERDGGLAADARELRAIQPGREAVQRMRVPEVAHETVRALETVRRRVHIDAIAQHDDVRGDLARFRRNAREKARADGEERRGRGGGNWIDTRTGPRLEAPEVRSHGR